MIDPLHRMALFFTYCISINALAIKKGFGSTPQQSSSISTGVDIESCPCGSELTYKQCCQILHDGDCTTATPEMITRARYSAFVRSKPEFLIDTAHPLQKDYIRFTYATIDPRKTRRAWEKEIVSKNSEVYEFLRLIIVNGSASLEDNVINNTTTSVSKTDFRNDKDDVAKVCFQVLVRKKSDGTYIPFQETSIYRKASEVSLSERILYKYGSVKLEGLEWLYVQGDVSEIEPSIARKLVEDAPRYVKGASIRDRWEGTKSNDLL